MIALDFSTEASVLLALRVENASYTYVSRDLSCSGVELSFFSKEMRLSAAFRVSF